MSTTTTTIETDSQMNDIIPTMKALEEMTYRALQELVECICQATQNGHSWSKKGLDKFVNVMVALKEK